MKTRLFFILLSFSFFVSAFSFATPVHAAGYCEFSTSIDTYVCYVESGGAPPGCTQIGASAFSCKNVPTGYRPPSSVNPDKFITISCTDKDFEHVECPLSRPKPNNCEVAANERMVCLGFPEGGTCTVEDVGYTCTISGTADSGNTTPNQVPIRSSTDTIICNYDPSLQISRCNQINPLPANCNLGAIDEPGVMICRGVSQGLPTGYTCDSSGGTYFVCTPGIRTTAPAVKDPCTDAGGGLLGYCPLEPLPGLEDPSKLNFAQLLGLLFNVLFTIGALLAVVMLVIGGISYMVSGAFESTGEAKRRMQAAVWGLVILAGAWLILYTINPQLLTFDLSVPGANSGGTPTTPTTPAANTTNAPPPRPQIQQALIDCAGLGKHTHYGPDGSIECI